MATWMVLLLTAATAAADMATNISLESRRLPEVMNYVGGAFVPSPSTQLKKSVVTTIPLTMSQSPSSNQITLQQQIVEGAVLKLMQTKDSSSSTTTCVTKDAPRDTKSIPKGQQYTYYIREGQRTEINEITDALMDSFHPNGPPAFDSYIRRYKYNHLKMCFDAIDENDRGLFVACAVSESPTLDKDNDESVQHKIIGFCSVDGRTPDPSCKIEFLTPSTLAGTSPRPYLSDLGVSTKHRGRGIGKQLVRACEQWTNDKGYDKLYLKVEKENKGAVGLYTSMGYKKTKLPWGRNDVTNTEGHKWDMTLLLEKSVMVQKTRRKRTWIKNQLWKKVRKRVSIHYKG